MSDNVTLSFTDISQRIKGLALPPVDLVIGIATGGTVPASLAAYQLDCPLVMLHINYRHPDNTPRGESPVLLSSQPLPTTPQRILLVDDVCVSGKTLDFARGLLTGHEIITFVLKGRGDFVAFPEIAACVNWPWKLPTAAATPLPEI